MPPRDTGFPQADAQNDFLRARRQRALTALSGRLRRERGDIEPILPYEEVVAALGYLSERSAGLRTVPLDAIVGTVDRGRDFDRSFRPTSPRVRGRWERIASAMRRGESACSPACARSACNAAPGRGVESLTVPAAALPPFQSLLDAHAGAILRFLRSRLPGADADDAFQETFLSALRAYPALRSGENLEGWLFTIAHRKSLDVHRRGRRELPLDAAPEPGAEDPPVFDAALWRRVDALPPRQRTAVALRFACDLTYAEIAAQDGGTEEAARRNVFAALTTLRREIPTP